MKRTSELKKRRTGESRRRPPGGRESWRKGRAIDRPLFAAAGQEDAAIGPSVDVLGLAIGDEAKAYPLHLLHVFHVINDSFGGEGALITYCPRCEAAIAFRSRTPSGSLSFAVLGLDEHGRLQLMDRESESVWSQEGIALSGPFKGTSLEWLPSLQTNWLEWKALYPASRVLSESSLTPRELSQTMRMIEYRAQRNLSRDHARAGRDEAVIGVLGGGEALHFPLTAMGDKAGVIQGDVGGGPFVVFWDPRGSTARAYSRTIEGVTLGFVIEPGETFSARDDRFGAAWDIAGRSARGDMRLSSLTSYRVKLSYWLAAHPESRGWQGDAGYSLSA